MTIKILIADDHGVLRAGLRSLLNSEEDFTVVGEAENGLEALNLAGELRPDVALVDINMPKLNGLEVLHRICAQYPEINVLFLTVHEDTGLLKESLRAGAAGFIPKRAVETELVQAIRQVARGERYVHPSMTLALLEEKAPTTKKDPEITLTTREIDVLRLISRGYTNRQIAEEFNLSIRTVESYRANLMNKLGLHSRVDLVKFASEKGIT
jgi:two-component system response regulator NreC